MDVPQQQRINHYFVQPTTKDGQTPLMNAARSASDETVSLLLSLGANPDKTDVNGISALMAAIQSKCSTTINLLAPVTQVNLGEALRCLAKEKVELATGELRQLVAYLIFVIFFTLAKFLENKIYTAKRQFFALNL